MGLYDKSGEIGLQNLIELEFNKMSKEGLSSYIDVYDLKSFFEELYDPNLTVSEFKSNILIQKQNLEKVLPELKIYTRTLSFSEKDKQNIYNNSEIKQIYDLGNYEGNGGAVAGFTLDYENKSLGYAMIDPNYSIRYITIYPEYEGFGLATKFVNEIRKAVPDKEMSISLINNPQMFKVGKRLGGVKLSETKVKLPSWNSNKVELSYKTQPQTSTQKSTVQDNQILSSPQFKEFYNKELESNPNLTVEEALDYYKKCKNNNL